MAYQRTNPIAPPALEFHVTAGANLEADIERACTHATGNSRATAVSVPAAGVRQAGELLFGTGVETVGMLRAGEELTTQARRVLAAGAAEIAVPLADLNPQTFRSVQALLGSAVPLTVDLTNETTVELDEAEQLLRQGASFVSMPASDPASSTIAIAALLRRAGALDLGGVKVRTPASQQALIHQVIQADDWALRPGNTRLCLPVAGDLRP